MRFAIAHKAATYLMLAFAYVAMIGGGAVPGAIALAGLVGLAGSWWWEPPFIRYEKWTLVWTIASLIALVYAILAAVVSGDFLGVGAQFLIWLVVAKAYNRRAARDWQQLYLLAFLMLVAGSVLDADLMYGACFLGFVVAATWAVTLFHLRREMEDNLLVKHAADRASERVEVRRILDSKRIVGGRFFAGTGALSFAVFLGSAIVFLALPRVGFGFFLKNRGGLNLVGFSDGVHLGDHGKIKDDPTVVMRVEIDAKRGGREAPAIHWRGVAFDHYEHGSWSRTPEAPATIDQRDWPRHGIERHTLKVRDAVRTQPDNIAEESTRQEIWLDPLDSNVLFGASTPRVYELAQVARQRPRTVEQNDELRVEHGNTIHYTVWSELDAPTPDELRRAKPFDAEHALGLAVYLQIPPEITERTRELAHQITDGLTSEYDRAAAIQRWLDANLSYTLDLPDPRRDEPLDFFLFESKRGHCEYFASAFALLAREAGIPVRQVNGFLGGEWNEYQGYVAVRAGDAHSWDEVYFPGHGWVTFDPTPPGRHDPLGRGGDGWHEKLGRFLDTMKFQWTKWVIEYDLVAQIGLFKDVGSALKSGALALKAALGRALHYWPIAMVLALAIALVVALRRRGAGGRLAEAIARPRRRARGAIARVYDEVVRQLGRAGIAREPATTPRELADRLAARGHAAAADVRELTDLLYAAEWGGRTAPAAEVRAQALAISIRAALRDATRKRLATSA